MEVDYSKRVTPKEYICNNCNAANIKLWRQYQTIQPKLICAKCASGEQGIDISTMNPQGSYMSEYGWIDQIGWYVPAVPDEEGISYWGYTSVPDRGVEWWKGLSNEPTN